MHRAAVEQPLSVEVIFLFLAKYRHALNVNIMGVVPDSVFLKMLVC